MSFYLELYENQSLYHLKIAENKKGKILIKYYFIDCLCATKSIAF